MADVTISNLGDLTPTGNTLVPISNGVTTGKALLSTLQVDYTNLTNKPPVGINGMLLYSAGGTYSWQVPTGITRIKIQAIGGGAGGGPSGGNAGGSSYITGVDIVAGAGSGVTAGSPSGSLLIYGAAGNSGVLGSTAINPGLKLLGLTSFGSGGRSGTTAGRSGGTGAYASGVATVTSGVTLTINVGVGGGPIGGSGSSGAGEAGCILLEW